MQEKDDWRNRTGKLILDCMNSPVTTDKASEKKKRKKRKEKSDDILNEKKKKSCPQLPCVIFKRLRPTLTPQIDFFFSNARNLFAALIKREKFQDSLGNSDLHVKKTF